MQLSPNFSLKEFTDSEMAARHGIDNTPPSNLIPSLRCVADGLERVRALLNGSPIIITSGYRCQKVNQLVGGKQSSQHVLGQAADFKCPSFGTPAQVMRRIVNSSIPYDQVIMEFGQWVHISFAERTRRMALVIDSTGTRSYV